MKFRLTGDIAESYTTVKSCNVIISDSTKQLVHSTSFLTIAAFCTEFNVMEIKLLVFRNGINSNYK